MKAPNSALPLAVLALLLPAARSQQFEVASLKPNPDCENRGGSFSPSPGRLEMPCVTLASLVQTAYGTFADGATINTQSLHTEGGPSWMQSEHYSLSAKSEAPLRTEMLAGPMLQALLEERFQLKSHREMREIPVYAMTVVKGGLKVQPLAEGACAPIDLSHPPPPPKPGEPRPNLCGVTIMGPAGKGDMTIEVRGATMIQLAQRLSGRVDRTIVDKTGIPGMFNFHLEFAGIQSRTQRRLRPRPLHRAAGTNRLKALVRQRPGQLPDHRSRRKTVCKLTLARPAGDPGVRHSRHVSASLCVHPISSVQKSPAPIGFEQ